MEIRHLRTFLVVADRGSFSAAAEALHCVQSNVTARIKTLERHLGGALFARSKNGAQLTALGESLVGHAKDILARLAAAESDLMDAAGGGGALRLGSLETAAGSRLPPLMRALGKHAPKARITLTTGPTATLTRSLWERHIDAAFVTGPIDADRFCAVPAFCETLVVARRKGHPGADALLAFKDGCSYRATAFEWLRAAGQPDTPVLEMASMESIMGCVEAGMGFAVAPKHAVSGYRAARNIETSPLPAALRRSQTVLAWRIDTRPGHALKTLCTLLRA